MMGVQYSVAINSRKLVSVFAMITDGIVSRAGSLTLCTAVVGLSDMYDCRDFLKDATRS